MTSADELFRKYAAAFEADEQPSAADYLGQLEGDERFALELMIDTYIEQVAPPRSFDQKRLDTERLKPWARKAREAMAVPSTADIRFAREEQDLTVEEVAEKVLAGGGIESPSAEEKSKAADYLGRLEAGELGRLSRNAWGAIKQALDISIAFPSTGAATGYSMALRKSPPQSPGTLGSEPPESFDQAEAILFAYSTPSPSEWDRVDEFFLGED